MAKNKDEVGEALHLGDDENLKKWEKRLEASEPQGELFKQVAQEIKKQGRECPKDCY